MHSRPALVASLITGAVLLSGCQSTDEPQASPESPDRAPVASAEWRESGAPGATEYVALGDSYVTAPGVPITDENNACFPSSNNYPALVAAELDVDHLIDASCGGATTEHLTSPQGPGRPAQFDALSDETTLVTITIGGNDNGVFSQLVTQCVSLASTDPTGSPCRDTLEADPETSLLLRLEDSAMNVERSLARITELAPEALVVVVGYPAFLPPSGTCHERFPLATGDYDYAREINASFNEALAKGAANHGVEYVDLAALSTGHDICSDDPWVNGAVYLPDRAAPYHPFAAEQEAAAEAIAEVVTAQG